MKKESVRIDADKNNVAGDWKKYAILFALVYFAQGMGGNPGIFSVSLNYVLKDNLKLTAAAMATFFSLMYFAWNVKPLYGLIADFIPFLGSRRKSYMIATSILSGLGILAVVVEPKISYWLLLLPLMFASLGWAFNDVVYDATMVEQGQAMGLTGRFQSVKWGIMGLASVLIGVGGGYLANYFNYKFIFGLSVAAPLAVLMVSIFLVKGEKLKVVPDNFQLTLAQTKIALKDKNLWIVAGFLFFWNFSPSFGTPLFFYQTNVLKFSKIFIGVLGSVSSIGAIIGAVVFWRYCKKIPLKILLNLSVASGVIGTLAYFGLVGPKSAIALNLIFGAFGTIALLTVLDLAAKSSPRKIAATVFACLTSSLNIGGMLSAILGGHIYDAVGLKWLIVISAAFTALCWLIVPYLKLDFNSENSEK
jgi:MFS family permease